MARHAFALLVLSLLTGSAGAIVGGRPAQDGDAPWMVAIINTGKPAAAACLDSGGSETFCQQICGGTLISPDWVLTAAHCLINTPYQDLRVLPGMTNLNAPGLIDKYIAISDARLHPDAPVEIETYYRNDLALLRLASPATTTPASIITLEALEALEQAEPVADDGITVFGWGQLGPDGPFPARLQRVSMEMPPSACASAWAMAPWDADIWACSVETDAGAIEVDDAGDPTPRDEGGEGICVLDSGGPLVVGNPDGGLLAGVVSWGQQDECGNADYPTVHTRVPYFLDWIEAATLAGGAPLQDVGLEIAAPTTASATATPAVVVTLRNATSSAGVPAPAFTLRYIGTAALALSGTNMASCVDVAGGWDCSYTGGPTMPAESSATVTLTASAAATNQEVLLEAALSTYDSAADYRRGNDRIEHQLTFTDSPDLRLSATGITQGGTTLGWIMATASNASAHANASAAKLVAVLPNGISFSEAAYSPDGSPVACTGSATVTCSLGNLDANKQLAVRLAVRGTRNLSGILTLRLQAGEDDYPAEPDGQPDTHAAVRLAWGTPGTPPSETPTPPPAPTTSAGGGGGAPGMGWLLVLGALGARRIGRR
jgi:secreted trypsin-like serine protease